ncbi:hypothetical protein BO226_08910 [Rhodococcus sp. 2G]|nr:hypothetical protein BO226_08910 [Rhodococcus sp. 2G]
MVVAASMLVALSACSTDNTPSAGDDSGVNTATTTVVDAPDVCAGSTDCVVLAETDIDGDSLPDTVRRTGDVLEVLTATGARAHTSATSAERLQNPDLHTAGGFVGVLDINGRPGDEIVVADELLDGSGRYQVFTWQRGNLAVISTPIPLYSGDCQVPSFVEAERVFSSQAAEAAGGCA